VSILPRPEYRSITVPARVYDILYDEYEKQKDELSAKQGIRSFSGYVSYRLNQIVEESTQFSMLNHDARGVKVHDNKLHLTADVQITPEGIYCPVCDASNCEHIRYALRQPDVLEIVRTKRKEGWKLPDI
jgi:hypothetical protein